MRQTCTSCGSWSFHRAESGRPQLVGGICHILATGCPSLLSDFAQNAPVFWILTSYFIFWNLSLEETAVYALLPFPPIPTVVEHRAGHGASLYYISQLILPGCDPGGHVLAAEVSGSSIWKSPLSSFGLCLFHSVEGRWRALEEPSQNLRWHWDWSRCIAKCEIEGLWLPDTLYRVPSEMPAPWFLL